MEGCSGSLKRKLRIMSKTLDSAYLEYSRITGARTIREVKAKFIINSINEKIAKGNLGLQADKKLIAQIRIWLESFDKP